MTHLFPFDGMIVIAAAFLSACEHAPKDDSACVDLTGDICDDYGHWYWMCDDCGTTWGCDGESQLTWTSGGGRPCSCLNENGGIDTAYQTDTGWVNKECQSAHPD